MKVFCLIAVATGILATATLPADGQEVWCAAGDAAGELQYVIGEPVMQYAAPSQGVLGFVSALQFVCYNSDVQIVNEISIQVHFDAVNNRATVYMAAALLEYMPSLHVYGTNGILYLHDTITTVPYTFSYQELPPGVYILRVGNIPDVIPYVNKWIKKR